MANAERPKHARNKFLREKKERKQREAQERQAAYDALTVEQKVAKLDAGGYVAAKQRAKLQQPQPQRAFTSVVVPETPKKAKKPARNDKKAQAAAARKAEEAK